MTPEITPLSNDTGPANVAVGSPAPTEESLRPKQPVAVPEKAEGTPAWVLIALAACVMLSCYAIWRTTLPPAAAPVYSLDVDAVIVAKQIQLDGLKDPGAYSAEMSAFTRELSRQLEAIKRRDATVLRRDALIASDSAKDLTPLLAAALGLSKELPGVPIRQAQQRQANLARARAQLGIPASDPAAASGGAADPSGSSAPEVVTPLTPVPSAAEQSKGASDAKSASDLD